MNQVLFIFSQAINTFQHFHQLPPTQNILQFLSIFNCNEISIHFLRLLFIQSFFKSIFPDNVKKSLEKLMLIATGLKVERE
jgi:hypothetical protein